MIYLDHAAAAPVSAKAFSAMIPYFSERFFNPSAPYLPAKHVRDDYEAAKNVLAHTIGAKGVDLIMTSGATESINLAFTTIDVIKENNTQNKSIEDSGLSCEKLKNTAFEPKVLVLATEHTAVLQVAKKYQYEIIPVDKNGLIRIDALSEMLDDTVVLVSIALANNELGTIQPFSEINELLRKTRQNRLARGLDRPLYLHSDASQALGLIEMNVARLGVDLLTLNSGKCGGPKGVGALYVAHGVRLGAINRGGGQERGLRSGTENVAGTIGFATAAVESQQHLSHHRELYQKMSSTMRQELAKVEQYLKKAVDPAVTGMKNAPRVVFWGNPQRQLANFCPISFVGLDAERLIYALENEEIYVSTGAACAANKGLKSHVLSAIGLTDQEIMGSLRISFGSTNTLEDAQKAGKIIAQAALKEYRRLGLTNDKYDDKNEHYTIQSQEKSQRTDKIMTNSHFCDATERKKLTNSHFSIDDSEKTIENAHFTQNTSHVENENDDLSTIASVDLTEVSRPVKSSQLERPSSQSKQEAENGREASNKKTSDNYDIAINKSLHNPDSENWRNLNKNDVKFDKTEKD